MKRAEEMLDRMTEYNLKPDVVSFTALVDGYCKEGNMKRAEEMLDRMTEYK